jgi:predicted nucleotidyltransferase
MSSEKRYEFTKENINLYLKEIAREYRKQAGKKMPAELVLIGGASVLINYGFRNMTTDIDALIQASSVMKEAINHVGDRYGLPNGWLNADFMTTDSYSEKLSQFSVYYKTYANIVTIRTVAAEYLIAMKLRSGRQYKSDLSDILGILTEHKKRGMPISMEQIRTAVTSLYGNWESLPETSQVFIENVMENGHFDELYEEAASGEKEVGALLVQFEQNYPNAVTGENVDEIVGNLQKKTDRATILAKLREKKTEIDLTKAQKGTVLKK